MIELWNTLSGEHGAISAAMAWMASSRIALKPFNAWILEALHNITVSLQSDPDPYIANLVWPILQSRSYRIAAWLLDLCISLKLPTAKSLDLHIMQNKTL